jgi:acetyl-CoA synthetase
MILIISVSCQVLVYHNERATTKPATNWVEGRDLWWHETVAAFPKECEVEWVEADHPLFLLYTSGSTGKRHGPDMVGYHGRQQTPYA